MSFSAKTDKLFWIKQKYMELSLKKGDLRDQECDLLVVNEFEDFVKTAGATGDVNDELEGDLLDAMKEDGFKGKLGSWFLYRTRGGIGAKRVLVVGLGKKSDFNIEVVRQVAATSMRRAKYLNSKTVVSILHGAGAGKLAAKDCARAIAEGALLANYSFTKFKSKKTKSTSPNSFTVVTTDGRSVRGAQKGLEEGRVAARGTIFARDLVNTPAQDMHPQALVDAAKEIASNNKNIKIRVLDEIRMKKMGAGGILGVSQGSEHPSFLVHMIYTPEKKAKKRVALVGKAVTFDSGGLSLKPANYMETMKVDMAGAAAVIGLFSEVSNVAPAVEVHGIFGAVENMPSGKAVRPGDVLTSINKKTIEVLNTDAEGRLTLADALSYAEKQKPDYIIDLATLTGACVVALGEEITGVMSNNPKLANVILESAAAAGEKMWELPLEKSYSKLIRSDVADIKNIGGRWGGALTAGLFLQEFIKDTPWAHLDIAGPAYAERVIDSYTPKGATGHGVRTLIHYLKSL